MQLDKLIKTKKLKTRFSLVPGYAYEITFPQTKKFIDETINQIRDKYDFVKEIIFKKPKLPWQEILETKGYPIFSKQISVLLNRIQKVKSKNGLTRWIFKIDTAKYGLSKERLFLLDKNMRTFPNNKTNKKIDDDYFGPTLYNNDYTYSEKCCNYVKGGLKKIKWPTFVGTMASESNLRKQSWIKEGCNIINSKKQLSRPLSIWTEKDIWKYILKHNVEINQMYGFDKTIVQDDDNNNQIDQMINKLTYKRLGCISCPYGAHLETDENRFVKLKEQSELLYQSQVIKNGMYKVLIDMGIKIQCDKKYMALYEDRWKAIKEWNNNIEDNIFNVIAQVENHQNYKKYNIIKQWKSIWCYSLNEIKQILNNYHIQLNEDEIARKITKYRKIVKEKYNHGNK